MAVQVNQPFDSISANINLPHCNTIISSLKVEFSEDVLCAILWFTLCPTETSKYQGLNCQGMGLRSVSIITVDKSRELWLGL